MAEASTDEQSLMHWSGPVWRVHGKSYTGDDAGGSGRRSGRFHRAPDQFQPHECWLALYVSLAPEIIRNTDPAMMPKLNSYRLTELRVELQAVLDLREPDSTGVELSDLLDGRNYSIAQEIARDALRIGAEGILVPSATRLGDNLVIFPDNLRSGSRLEVVASRDPVLYVERD